jgi:UDP-N-acetylglucosamine transferase subunit ALG13
MSGRMISRIPGVELYCQYPHWADEKWRYGGSVFDVFEPTPRSGPPASITSAVVTLGTRQGFDFRRLLERLITIMPADCDVLWQTGNTDVTGLSIAARPEMPAAELKQAMTNADVVIAHAGVGSAIAALELGKAPVLVPRREHLGEHVDDHQIQVARELEQRGLAVVADASELEVHHLLEAAQVRVSVRESVPPLALRTP